MLLLIESPPGYVQECYAGPVRRLLTRLLRVRLTEHLADGVPPDSSVLLTLRARELIGHAHRRDLASRLFALLDESVGAHAGAPLVDWVGVRRARWELGELAVTLEAPGPVAARGVALVEQLLSDGAGPLFYPDDPHGLARAATAATLGLDPCSPPPVG